MLHWKDFTGVHNFPGGSNWDWVGAGCRVGTCTEAKPSDTLCKTFFAWEAMVRAASRVGTKAMTEPMRYDLIVRCREYLIIQQHSILVVSCALTSI